MSNVNRKITSNELKTFDSSYFIGKSHFEADGVQKYLVFQPIVRYFKVNIITNADSVSSRKSKGLSAESIKLPITSDNSLTSKLNYYDTKTKVYFDGDWLKQVKVTFNHGKVVNIYIVYGIIRIANSKCNRSSNLIVQNALFGAVSLTKNADVNKYKYSGYGIGFDRTSSFSFPGIRNSHNVIIFGVDMNSPVHVDNKRKYILILGKVPTQGVGEHSLTAGKMYSINFSKDNIKFCLSLHYNGANSYLFVNGTEIYKFKSKGLEVVASPLCRGKMSKDWSADNMRKTGFTVYVSDFSVDYDSIDVDDVKDIDKYLMKKNDIV